MSTWIAWPPDEPVDKFPQNYFYGDPLDEFQKGFEEEKCKQCGFSVKFISDKYQYEGWNRSTHNLISGILENQRKIGECPMHPKPNWMY